MKSISAIFATDLQGGVGYQSALPWPHLTSDFAHFRRQTLEQCVIMGRSTWDSKDFPNPLKNRINIVLSTRGLDAEYDPSIVKVCSGKPQDICNQLDQIPEIANTNWFVIGGAKVLAEWLPVCDTVWHTEVQGVWPADCHFHIENWRADFRLMFAQNYQDPDNKVSFTIAKYIR